LPPSRVPEGCPPERRGFRVRPFSRPRRRDKSMSAALMTATRDTGDALGVAVDGDGVPGMSLPLPPARLPVRPAQAFIARGIRPPRPRHQPITCRLAWHAEMLACRNFAPSSRRPNRPPAPSRSTTRLSFPKRDGAIRAAAHAIGGRHAFVEWKQAKKVVTVVDGEDVGKVWGGGWAGDIALHPVSPRREASCIIGVKITTGHVMARMSFHSIPCSVRFRTRTPPAARNKRSVRRVAERPASPYW